MADRVSAASSDPRLRRDRNLLYAAAFLRALAIGYVAVLLTFYLSQLSFTPAEIGLVVGSGLAGTALATFVVTLGSERIGRRRTLRVLALLAAAGGAAAAAVSSPLLLGIVAFLGMMNGMGRDRGGAVVLEQAILPATTTEVGRTRSFAWYNVLQDAGHALGGLLAGLPVALQELIGWEPLTATRVGLAVYATLFLLTALLSLGLSPALEVGTTVRALRVSPASRGVLWKLSALFALDSVAGGFLTTALLAFFFFERFGVGPVTVGLLFFGARVANALSHLAAARLARRFGLVNTMVFTHIPSSLLLATVPFAPSFPVAAALFLIREGLVEMDVPTRQSYVMAVVRPEERTVAAGVTQLVRLCGWTVGPVIAGALMGEGSLAVPLLLGAGMKVVYDIALYAAFRNLKPPEEGGGA